MREKPLSKVELALCKTLNSLSQKELREEIQINPQFITLVKNPTAALQILPVTKAGGRAQDIKNPTIGYIAWLIQKDKYIDYDTRKLFLASATQRQLVAAFVQGFSDWGNVFRTIPEETQIKVIQKKQSAYIHSSKTPRMTSVFFGES